MLYPVATLVRDVNARHRCPYSAQKESMAQRLGYRPRHSL